MAMAVGLCLSATAAHAALPPVDLTVVTNEPDEIVLSYQFGPFTHSTVDVDGMNFTQIGFAPEPLLLERGAPELPHVVRSLAVDQSTHGANLVVIDAEYYDIPNIDIAPSKGHLPRTVNPADVPYSFGVEYGTDAFYPGRLAKVSKPYTLRDLRGLSVDVFPFQYNPVQRTLRVYTDMTVRVAPNLMVAQFQSLTPQNDRPLSRAFHQIYQAHFVNYTPTERYTPLDETGDLLIICYDAWLGNIQPLVNHKNSIGINTTAVGVSTIGNNSTAIKNYIQSIYNSSDLAFVLLVGDASQVATPSASGGASDPTYSKMTGDNYPDILVGRFSAESAAHVDTQVQRTIEYENMPATQQAWFYRGTGVASNQGPGDDGEYDDDHMNNIRADLLANDYTVVDQIYDPYASASQVSSALNAGRGIVNYCGHGSTTSWGSSGFSNSHVNALTNVGMLPFIFSVACVNGNFTSSTCFGEAWLRATSGGEPTGAIATYMSSINQDWNPPMAAQDEFVDLLCADAYFSFGALCYAGSCRMMDEYGTSGVNMFNTWHVFGDPSVRVYGTAQPPPLTIALPDGTPETIRPGVTADINVEIADGEETYVPGTGLLHYSYDGGPFSTAPLTHVSGDLYQATLPPASCTDTPEYYFSAQGNGGSTVYNPMDAPEGVYTAIIGQRTVVMHDDCETNPGWTTDTGGGLSDGQWNRGVPVNCDRGDPPADYDGSGQCWLTDNSAANDCNSDVDGGYVYLMSPTIDLSEGDAEISFAIWYSNYFGADPNNDLFKIYVSNNNGASWTLVETLGPASSAGWNVHAFMVGDYVAPTATVKVRFEASDLNSGSVVEAGVDAFHVERFSCNPPAGACCFADGTCQELSLDDCDAAGGAFEGAGTSCDPNPCPSPWCLGDADCSQGPPTFEDILYFAAAVNGESAWYNYHISHQGHAPDCDYLINDMDGVGGVTFADIVPFANAIGAPCQPW